MIPLLAVVIPIGVGVACSTAKKKGRRSMGLGHPRRRPGCGDRRAAMTCDPWPFLEAEVYHAVLDALERGIEDERKITTHVLRTVYPETVDGRPVRWPCRAGYCDAMRAIQYRTAARVSAIVAELEDHIAGGEYQSICERAAYVGD